jgi:hypothetical protein
MGGWGGDMCGMSGMGGMCGMCGGFGAPCPAPYQQPQGCCSGHKCHRNGCHGGQTCPRCGYPGCGSPWTGYAYPVAGWSVMDGFNGFADPNCFGGQGCGFGCGHCGGHSCGGHCSSRCGGLFNRCHKQPEPPPCPYGPPPQPWCFGMGDCCPF